jgi:putative membrane protein insertion efficiency factor
MLFWRATPLPLANSQCRFYPSCSEYAEMAIESKGVLRGSAKTFYRVLRCHPLSRGGVDMP